MIEYLKALAEPIAMLIGLIAKDDHTAEEEEQFLLTAQRAIFNERARRRDSAHQ